MKRAPKRAERLEALVHHAEQEGSAMTNTQSVTETRSTMVPWKYVVRDRLIAELCIRASAWRRQEYVLRHDRHTDETRDQYRARTDRADQCRVRAEVLEQLAHDLDDPRLTLGARVGAL